MHRLAHLALPLTLVAALAAPSLAQTAVVPAAGDLAISEIHFLPVCSGSQNHGEWFELTNISTKVLDLNGLYFQDGPTPGSTQRWFQVLPSVATLPPLFPAQRFLFCRSANAFNNGGLANVDYAYAAIGSPLPPADNSQVGEGQMNFSSQDPDGMHITVGAPFIQGGTLIESASYAPLPAPFLPPFDLGYSAERINLFLPMQQSGGQNSPNLAAALSTDGFGVCSPPGDFGTPRLPNSNDESTWGIPFDDASFPNSGTMSGRAPLSLSAGLLQLRTGAGAAGFPFFLGYAAAPSLPGLPMGAFFPGNPGSIVIDLVTAQYAADPSFSFDLAGECLVDLGIPNQPSLLGLEIAMQWLAIDATLTIVQSHGLKMTFIP